MEIIYDGARPQQTEAFEEAARITLETEGMPGEFCQISVTFVSPEEIQELNAAYRGKDAVTDVLSFPQFEDLNQVDVDREWLLGDVVINPLRAQEQAQEYGHSEKRELTYLFVHSLLHLLWYDHEEEEDKKEMRGREEEIMQALDLVRGV